MLRLIVRSIDAAHCPHVGGSPHEEMKTFDISAPEVEAYLRSHDGMSGVSASLIGVEVVEPKDVPEPEKIDAVVEF